MTPVDDDQTSSVGRAAEAARGARPLHLRWRTLGLIAAGGAIGTAVREAVALVVPGVEVFPVAIFAINLVGAFALGLLLESLARSGPDAGRRRDIRLLVGTGVLGGFTTYSALATATAELGASGLPWWAAVYALGTVVIGAGMSVGGIAVAHLVGGRREAAS